MKKKLEAGDLSSKDLELVIHAAVLYAGSPSNPKDVL